MTLGMKLNLRCRHCGDPLISGFEPSIGHYTRCDNAACRGHRKCESCDQPLEPAPPELKSRCVTPGCSSLGEAFDDDWRSRYEPGSAA